MFTKKIDEIFTLDSLKQAFDLISQSSKGLDEISYEEFKNNLNQNLKTLQNEILTNNYSPEPLKKILIKKDDKDEFRPISIASIKDKIVQKHFIMKFIYISIKISYQTLMPIDLANQQLQP